MTFRSLFGCNQGIRAILVTFGSILASIQIAIRLYSGCPKSNLVNFWRFCLIQNLFGIYSSLNQLPESEMNKFPITESFRFRPYSGRIGPNLFGRIRFWCNPCIWAISTVPLSVFFFILELTLSLDENMKRFCEQCRSRSDCKKYLIYPVHFYILGYNWTLSSWVKTLCQTTKF